MVDAKTADRKELRLTEELQKLSKVIVAFSGGVDSSYLADMAYQTLKENAHIVLAESPSIPSSEVHEARKLAQLRCWPFQIIKTNEMEKNDYTKNDAKRCYHCKNELFEKLKNLAKEKDIKYILYGAIQDDIFDIRPGELAAREHAILAPLQKANLSKEEIRYLSEKRKLPTHNKAAFACLSSRFQTGIKISKTKLNQIERAEDVLRELLFHQYRVRYHDDICRIEIEDGDIQKIMDVNIRRELVMRIRAIGFKHITLDLAGYHNQLIRTGKQEISPLAHQN